MFRYPLLCAINTVVAVLLLTTYCTRTVHVHFCLQTRQIMWNRCNSVVFVHLPRKFHFLPSCNLQFSVLDADENFAARHRFRDQGRQSILGDSVLRPIHFQTSVHTVILNSTTRKTGKSHNRSSGTHRSYCKLFYAYIGIGTIQRRPPPPPSLLNKESHSGIHPIHSQLE